MIQQTMDFDRPAILEADSPRLNKQCLAILERLRRSPVTNTELNAIAFRYSARLFELRKAGHVIETEKRDGGLVVYTLKGGE